MNRKKKLALVMAAAALLQLSTPDFTAYAADRTKASEKTTASETADAPEAYNSSLSLMHQQINAAAEKQTHTLLVNQPYDLKLSGKEIIYCYPTALPAVSIDDNQVLTAAEQGSATFTVGYMDQKTLETEYIRYKFNFVAQEQLSTEQLSFNLCIGDTKTLPIQNQKLAEYAVGKNSGIRVSKDGVVSAVQSGTYKLRALINGYQAVYFTVTVPEISVSETSCTLELSGAPEEISLVNYKGSVEWKSEDETVATVKDGRIVPKSGGITTVYTTIGDTRYEVEVTVISDAIYYFYNMESPDSQSDFYDVMAGSANYISRGVAVTEEEKAWIISTITHEEGGCKAGCVATAQCIRDSYLYLGQFDYTHYGTIDGIITYAFSPTYKTELLTCEWAEWAFDYVFGQGNSFYPAVIVGQRGFDLTDAERSLGYQVLMNKLTHYDGYGSKTYITDPTYSTGYLITNSTLNSSSWVNPAAVITVIRK